MIRIIAIGKAGKYESLIKEYEKRLRDIEVLEYKETAKEEQIEKAVKGRRIVLDVEGELMTSEDIAEMIKEEVTFIIGGAEGLSTRMKRGKKISFGRITLPHQLARLVLTEQIYRGKEIQKGTKYHK